MIYRHTTKAINEAMTQFPAVAVVGPRQCGKTTLAQSLEGVYFDLEQDSDRLSLDLQWDRLVSGDQLVILDEAQEWPEVFGRLRGAIDQDRKRFGRFLLLGSVSPALMKHVSESLAGRMALVKLTPFLRQELPEDLRDGLWFWGGYPDGGVLNGKGFPLWQLNYLEMLTARDLPNWGLPAKPQMTMRLLKMLAVLHGQLLNASRLGQSLDISYKTVQSYLDYLEGAFLIRQLQPYHSNLKKRLVKSPKLYWRDSGLLHALMNVADDSQLVNQPWVGAGWEGFVIGQILSTADMMGRSYSAFFLRTSDQHEIDLILDFSVEKWAIEIKLTACPTLEDIKSLNKVSDMIGAERRIMLSQTCQPIESDRTMSCNLDWLINKLLTV
ncbi:MAG: ATP-binding protein [Phycisphaeraceae bacterium]|nr:ATP-binding protein [Phycisphaeraceae bacterium]